MFCDLQFNFMPSSVEAAPLFPLTAVRGKLSLSLLLWEVLTGSTSLPRLLLDTHTLKHGFISLWMLYKQFPMSYKQFLSFIYLPSIVVATDMASQQKQLVNSDPIPSSLSTPIHLIINNITKHLRLIIEIIKSDCLYVLSLWQTGDLSPPLVLCYLG